jgi:hypothetical protein
MEFVPRRPAQHNAQSDDRHGISRPDQQPHGKFCMSASVLASCTCVHGDGICCGDGSPLGGTMAGQAEVQGRRRGGQGGAKRKWVSRGAGGRAASWWPSVVLLGRITCKGRRTVVVGSHGAMCVIEDSLAMQNKQEFWERTNNGGACTSLFIISYHFAVLQTVKVGLLADRFYIQGT